MGSVGPASGTYGQRGVAPVAAHCGAPAALAAVAATPLSLQLEQLHVWRVQELQPVVHVTKLFFFDNNAPEKCA